MSGGHRKSQGFNPLASFFCLTSGRLPICPGKFLRTSPESRRTSHLLPPCVPVPPADLYTSGCRSARKRGTDHNTGRDRSTRSIRSTRSPHYISRRSDHVPRPPAVRPALQPLPSPSFHRCSRPPSPAPRIPGTPLNCMELSDNWNNFKWIVCLDVSGRPLQRVQARRIPAVICDVGAVRVPAVGRSGPRAGVGHLQPWQQRTTSAQLAELSDNSTKLCNNSIDGARGIPGAAIRPCVHHIVYVYIHTVTNI